MQHTSLPAVIALCLAGTVCSQPPGSKPTSKPTTHATTNTPAKTADRGNLLLGVLNRLKSYETAQVAWGAHLAAKHKLTGTVHELRKTLRGLVDKKGHGNQLAAMALLDAFIQLDIKLPPAELDPWLQSHTLPAAMVLMARQPAKYEALLLDVFDSYKTNNWLVQHWLASGNLLVAIKSKRVVPHILKGLQVRVSINLYEQGQEEPDHSIGLGGGAGGTSPRYLRVPEKYPPVPLYRLERKKLPKARLLAAGAVPIYYQRQVSRKYRLRSSYALEKRAPRKLEWICDLLDVKVENQPFHLSDRAAVVWKDAKAYRRKIAGERTKVQGAFQSLIHRLRDKGLLTKDEAVDVQPIVSIRLFDHREQDRTLLPKLDGVTVERVEKKR